MIEAGLTIWGVDETGTTLMDPCASLGGKALSGGGLMMGAVLPGGGYGAGGKACRKVLGAGKKALEGLGSSADEVIASAGRAARPGSRQTRAVQALQKKVDWGNEAFQGLAKTRDAAEQVIREVLGSKNQVVETGTNRNGQAFTDVFDTNSGRGIRLIDGDFDTFVNY